MEWLHLTGMRWGELCRLVWTEGRKWRGLERSPHGGQLASTAAGDQGGADRFRRASDPGHEPFMLSVPEGRMGLTCDGGPGGRGVEGGERGAVSEVGLTP